MQKKAEIAVGIILIFLILSAFVNLANNSSWTQSISHIGSYSSPRAVDLNGDGTKDIIMGLGQLEFNYNDTAVVALNGKNGEVLWHTSSRDQMFGSASLADLTGDGTDDIVINGRSAELKAINGASGDILWEYFVPENSQDSARFHGLYNFYNAQFIPDQNGDQTEDIVISNGGDVLAAPDETDRPPGSLMVISGRDGELIAKAAMPDQKETYMSVVLHDLDNNGDLDVIYGTGGETIGGHLYRTTLDDILQEDLLSSVILASSENKGFIAPPALADITGDGVKDIIANAVDGRMLAIDGATNEEIWTVTIPDTEAYSSLAVGHFTDDETPDFFGSFATGVWPDLNWSYQFMVDGEKGEVVFEDSLGFFQTTSPVVADFTEDGRDDVLLPINYQVAELIWKYHYNLLMIFDFHNNTTYQIGEPVQGMNVSSTPWVGDLDNDQKLDIIYAAMGDSSDVSLTSGVHIRRLPTNITLRKPVKWGAYMGSEYNGVFEEDSKE